jgi:hypothetical protein
MFFSFVLNSCVQHKSWLNAMISPINQIGNTKRGVLTLFFSIFVVGYNSIRYE